MTPYKQNFTIKTWAEDDRPREKLMLKGRDTLSDAELIAILIGSGNTEDSAVELSKKILASVGNNLYELGKLNISDLTKFKGIGEAKAISIIAALELGRRRKDTEILDKTRITTSKDAANLFSHKLADLPHEEFWLALLNRNNKVIKTELISRGGVAGTVVDIKMILKTAVENLASGIIMTHNHPSGSVKPSAEDISLTKKIKEAAKFFDIALLDHVIIGDNNYYSFADEGIL